MFAKHGLRSRLGLDPGKSAVRPIYRDFLLVISTPPGLNLVTARYLRNWYSGPGTIGLNLSILSSPVDATLVSVLSEEP
jgi:hypothetical protein